MLVSQYPACTYSVMRPIRQSPEAGRSLETGLRANAHATVSVRPQGATQDEHKKLSEYLKVCRKGFVEPRAGAIKTDSDMSTDDTSICSAPPLQGSARPVEPRTRPPKTSDAVTHPRRRCRSHRQLHGSGHPCRWPAAEPGAGAAPPSAHLQTAPCSPWAARRSGVGPPTPPLSRSRGSACSLPPQDAFAVWDQLGKGDVCFAGIFDGHGPCGHYISRHVRERCCSRRPAAAAAAGGLQRMGSKRQAAHACADKPPPARRVAPSLCPGSRRCSKGCSTEP